MNLYQDILTHASSQSDVRIDEKELVEMTCYQTLTKIQALLDNEQLDDAACFRKIEEIVQLFEKIGSSGGIRHDFS